MSLAYVKPQPIWLKSHPEYDERWVQNRIAEDPSILGLGGDLVVLERERRQVTGGRLDMLLTDGDSQRYEVELMLGATDESHIIRALEYWDLERRRYPAYEHTAVVVAEDITSRFLNVLTLFSGSVPIVAIQLNALRVAESIVLNCVKVLDHRMLRTDDSTEDSAPEVDRDYWKQKTSDPMLTLVDDVLRRIQDVAGHNEITPNYTSSYIGLKRHERVDNIVRIRPRRRLVNVTLRTSQAEEHCSLLEEADLDAEVRGPGYLKVVLRRAGQVSGSFGEVLQRVVQENLARDG